MPVIGSATSSPDTGLGLGPCLGLRGSELAGKALLQRFALAHLHLHGLRVLAGEPLLLGRSLCVEALDLAPGKHHLPFPLRALGRRGGAFDARASLRERLALAGQRRVLLRDLPIAGLGDAQDALVLLLADRGATRRTVRLGASVDSAPIHMAADAVAGVVVH